MTLAEFKLLIKDAVPPLDDDTLFAVQYLEERGKAFCVDFGYQNAKDVAAEVARQRMTLTS